MTTERMLANLAEKVERRFFGKYRGLAVDNADPEHLGRLKLRVPSVLGSEVVTGWAMPCVPYGGDMNQGILFIPEVGAGVWVEFEAGDLEFPIWVGTFWSKPGGDSELPRPNDADGAERGSIQDPPTRKIIKTLKGHTIQLEDADGAEMVMVVDGTHGHVVLMNADGIKVTEGTKGHQVVLDSGGIRLVDAANNEVTMNGSGVAISDTNGNSVVMDGTSGFPAGHGVDINGGSRVCLEGLIDWLLTHQHVGNMGAPTPLFPADMLELSQAKAFSGSGILSDSVKVR